MAGTHFSGRTLSRSIALQLLFQAEATGRLVSEVLGDEYTIDQRLVDAYERELKARGFEPQEIDERLAEVEEYARQLALGSDAMLHELDAVIATTSSNWSVARMPSVDRNLLRLALYEMLQEQAVDTPVAIDECVELAKAYGTDESSRFVNGLLGKVARRREAGMDVVAVALAELAKREKAAAPSEGEGEAVTADGADGGEQQSSEAPDKAGAPTPDIASAATEGEADVAEKKPAADALQGAGSLGGEDALSSNKTDGPVLDDAGAAKNAAGVAEESSAADELRDTVVVYEGASASAKALTDDDLPDWARG